MKKFFFVTQVFYPDETATASVMTDLSVKLAERKDTEVEVWCAQPSYLTRVRQPRWTKYKGIKIKNLPGTNFRKENIAGRLVNYFTFSMSLFFTLLLSKEKGIIFTVTNPPFLGAIVWLISKIKKRPYIYIVHDVYPEGIVRVGKLSPTVLITKLWRKINQTILRCAKEVIVLGRDMNDAIKQMEPASCIKYIPNWHDKNHIVPLPFEENPFVIKNNLRDKFVVEYSGNMGLWHNLIPMAKVAKRLDGSVNFLFIGSGMRKNDLFEEWDNKIPESSLVLPYQPKSKINETLTACHVAIISLREGLEGMAVPSKLYGILAAGVPIIGMVPENSEVAFVIKEENCGYIIHPDDDQELEKAILDLKSNPEKQKLFGSNARKAFESKYTTEIIANKYYDLISTTSN